MLITTQNEILSMMPTARWDRPQQLFGYIEEEEQVALVPLLGEALYQHLLTRYDELRETYTDLTATTVRPTGRAKQDPQLAYADVTERLEQINSGRYREAYVGTDEEETDVPNEDLRTIRLIRVCQQIEFYRMLSHKAGMLTVSFNEGGGLNTVNPDGYDIADKAQIDRLTKDAYMSAGRATDTLLLMLEADAKGDRLFTEMWQEADAFYLHSDLLFQTARVLNEYLDINGERSAYIQLVRDIRFAQTTYLRPRIGGRLLKAVVAYANTGVLPKRIVTDSETGEEAEVDADGEVYEELLSLLRQALAFFVEARRTELLPAKEKLARRDSMSDAMQAAGEAANFVADNLDALGKVAEDSPQYKQAKAQEAQAAIDAADAEAAERRRLKAKREEGRRHIFTAFPATHRGNNFK